MARWRFVVILAIIVGTAAAGPRPATLRVVTYNLHHGEGTDGKLDLPRMPRSS